ncbi:hypothetical protein C8R42DRAFT_722746 [Lentinula raphanica]|nr:hypothetical protein C8R42DRAFT_722746 [Lentinula raphanica]
MLYTRTILPSMFLALACAGVIAAPAHVCRDLVPRGADGQEAQSQSSAPQRPTKSEEFRRCSTLSWHQCPGPSPEQWNMINFFEDHLDIIRESKIKFLIEVVSEVKENPCGRPAQSSDGQPDAAQVLKSYYDALTVSGFKKDFDKERVEKDKDYAYLRSWGTQ